MPGTGVGLLLFSLHVTAAAKEPNLMVKTSGSETVYCRSGWHPNEGLAESACYDELDRKRDEAIRILVAEGKRVIGGSHRPLVCSEYDEGQTVQHQCAGSSEVNWIEDGARWLTVPAELKPLGSTNKSASRLSAAKSADLVVAESVLQSVIVLDDELLKRFRAVFGNQSMELVAVSILASDVTVGEKISSLPTTITEENYIAENRTDTAQSRKFRVSIATTESERYTFTRSLVRGSSTSTSVGFNIKGVTASATARIDRTLTIGSTTENSFSTTTAYEEQFEQNVKPRTVMFIKVTRETLNDTYALKGAVLFEGTVRTTFRVKDVYACGFMGTDRCSRWKTNTRDYKLSQYLSEAQRKFEMDGVVTISSSANTNTTIKYAEVPISQAFITSSDEVPVIAPDVVMPEKDYRNVDQVPDNLVWKTVGTKAICGFWIFKREC